MEGGKQKHVVEQKSEKTKKKISIRLQIIISTKGTKFGGIVWKKGEG
jgi:hypothetical protein